MTQDNRDKTAKQKQEALDDALDDTFPASDPVPLTPPERGKAKTAAIPKVDIDDKAMPAEKPA